MSKKPKRPKDIPFYEYENSPCLEDRRLIEYINQIESKLKEAEVQINASKIGHNNLKIISKKQSDIIQAVKDSLYTDEEIGDIANMRVLKDEKPFRLIDVALNQKNRVLKALNQKP